MSPLTDIVIVSPLDSYVKQLQPMVKWKWTETRRSAAEACVRTLERDLQLLHEVEGLLGELDRLGSLLLSTDGTPSGLPLVGLSVGDATRRLRSISAAADKFIENDKALVEASIKLDEINMKCRQAEADVDDLMRKHNECARTLGKVAEPEAVAVAELVSVPPVVSRHPHRRQLLSRLVGGTSSGASAARPAEVARPTMAVSSAEVKRLEDEAATLERRLTASHQAIRNLEDERLSLERTVSELRTSVGIETITAATQFLWAAARADRLLSTFPANVPDSLGDSIRLKVADVERAVSDLQAAVPSKDTQRQLLEAEAATALKQQRRANAEAERSQRIKDAERAIETATKKRVARQAAKRSAALERQTARQIASLERHIAPLERKFADLTEEVRLRRNRRRAIEEALDTTTEALARTVAQRILRDHAPLPDWPKMTHHQREAAILANPKHFPAIDNLLAKQRSLQQKIADAEFREYQLRAVERSLETARVQLSTLRSGSRDGRPGRKPSQVVLDWQAAEGLARDYMKWLGFSNCQLTGGGADGGVDVMSTEGVGQVKMHNKGTGRPDVQQLFGIAAAEQRIPLMFAMSYTADAIAWAEKHRVAIFRFARNGDVEAASSEGQRLVDEGLTMGRSGVSPKKSATTRASRAKTTTVSSRATAGAGQSTRTTTPRKGKKPA